MKINIQGYDVECTPEELNSFLMLQREKKDVVNWLDTINKQKWCPTITQPYYVYNTKITCAISSIDDIYCNDCGAIEWSSCNCPPSGY